MEQLIDTIERIWEMPFVKALVYLIVAFVLAFVASFLVKKLFKLFKLDLRLAKWGINDGRDGAALSLIGKLVFLIVFLLFIPAVLSALGLDSVTEPITDFVSAFVKYIPNIIAALILVFLGIFIGQIVGQLLSALLAKTKIDSLTDRLKSKDENVDTEVENKLKLSVILGKAVYALIVLLSLVQAFTVLEIDAISAPAISVINAVFGAIPNILLAAVIITGGVIISNLVGALIQNLLKTVNLDKYASKMLPSNENIFSFERLIVSTVRGIIILFAITQAVEELGFVILTEIMAVIIGYLPMIIKAVIIAIIAYLGAGFASKTLGGEKSRTVSMLAKVIIYTVAAFMIFSQLGFAVTIVNLAFIIILGALGIAFAIAFGIGGRDFAKRTLEKMKVCPTSDEKGEHKKS